MTGGFSSAGKHSSDISAGADDALVRRQIEIRRSGGLESTAQLQMSELTREAMSMTYTSPEKKAQVPYVNSGAGGVPLGHTDRVSRLQFAFTYLLVYICVPKLYINFNLLFCFDLYTPSSSTQQLTRARLVSCS